MILTMMPFFSSKNFFDSADQLSKSLSTVSSFFGVGNGLVGSLAPSTPLGVDAVDDRAEALEGELALAVRAQHEVEPVLWPWGWRC